MYTTKQIDFNDYSELSDSINKATEKENLTFEQVVDVFKSGDPNKMHRAIILCRRTETVETKFIMIAKNGLKRCYVNLSKEKAIEKFCDRANIKIKDFEDRGYTVREMTAQGDFLTHGIWN